MSEQYEFVDTTLTEQSCPFPVTSMCRWLALSTSGFSSWQARPESATARRRDVLKALMTEEFTTTGSTPRTAGACRWAYRDARSPPGARETIALLRQRGFIWRGR